MIFHELKQKLSQQNGRKATWQEVAEHYKIPFFENKTNKQIIEVVSRWKARGLPTKVQLWIIQEVLS